MMSAAELANKGPLPYKFLMNGADPIMLEIGTKAPEFTLPDQNGNSISLSDFLGKKVVLYFYPKDNTPGCSR